MEPKAIVGRNIREIRLRRDLTQEELAHRVKMHLNEISRAERGVRDLRVSTIVKIAAGLEVSAADLLDGL